MTGRAAGYCAGSAAPGYASLGGRRGFWGGGRGGRGGGGGRGGWGYRNQFRATGLFGWQRAAMGYPAAGGAVPTGLPYPGPVAPAISSERELEALQGQAEYFANVLEDIRRRIEELQAKSEKQ